MYINFKIFWTINTYVRDIYNDEITLIQADENQGNL